MVTSETLHGSHAKRIVCSPGKSVTIREYHTQQREQVWSLFESGMIQNSEQATENLTRRRIATLLDSARPQFYYLDKFLCSDNGGKLFVALDGCENVVGMLGIRRRDEDIMTSSAELTRISVVKEWRRKGLCRALVDHAKNYANENFGTKRLYLITLSSVPTAMKTYTKLGFEEVESERVFTDEDSPRLVQLVKYVENS